MDAISVLCGSQLQEIPFEVLERLQETGHAVTSAAATGARATNKGKKRAAWDSSGADERDYKRANKNRPQEMSSKRPVPRFREVMQTTKRYSLRHEHVPIEWPDMTRGDSNLLPQFKRREVRDPRFESLSGKFNSDAFRKRYKFIYDEELPKEAARLKVCPKSTFCVKIQILLELFLDKDASLRLYLRIALYACACYIV